MYYSVTPVGRCSAHPADHGPVYGEETRGIVSTAELAGAGWMPADIPAVLPLCPCCGEACVVTHVLLDVRHEGCAPTQHLVPLAALAPGGYFDLAGKGEAPGRDPANS